MHCPRMRLDMCSVPINTTYCGAGITPTHRMCTGDSHLDLCTATTVTWSPVMWPTVDPITRPNPRDDPGQRSGRVKAWSELVTGSRTWQVIERHTNSIQDGRWDRSFTSIITNMEITSQRLKLKSSVFRCVMQYTCHLVYDKFVYKLATWVVIVAATDSFSVINR